MKTFETTVRADDGQPLFVRRWEPDAEGPQRGMVHVVHGMAEHSGRYARLAEALTGAGFLVHAHDHRGHGHSAGSVEELGHFGAGDGWGRVVGDLVALVRRERAEHPGLPLALFGHSMGSFMVQQVLYEHGSLLEAAVLSATNGKPDPLASAGRLVARAERVRLGERSASKILQGLSFDEWNKAFRPNRTAFDWLSRDAAEVDKYVADPRCGFACSATLWTQLLDALAELARPANHDKIRRDVPIYVFSGSLDPVGRQMRGVEVLLDAYRHAGLTGVTHRFYPGGRHEMLNEINRDEVTRDLVQWLVHKLPPRRSP